MGETGRITFAVTHNPKQNRFEATWEGNVAVLEYQENETSITFTHTGVPRPMEGKGAGSQLCAAGIEYAKENKLSIDPQCWFVAGYMKKKNIPKEISNL